MQCNARSKRSGDQCKNHAVTGNSKCRMHGGTSLAGIASPSFKTGRYSKFLPERLAARYMEALSDAKLLELRDEIALVNTRLGELVEHLCTGESAQQWQALQLTYADLRNALRRDDKVAVRESMDALAKVIDGGEQEYATWREIVAMTAQRRRLVESEYKRLLSMQQMVTTEQAMVLLARIVDTVRKHVSDPNTLAALSAEFRALSVINAG